MNFLRPILRFCLAMLFAMVGAGMAFAVTATATEFTYHQTENLHRLQTDHIDFAARAPPLAATNVAVTGGVTVMQGGVVALHGQEIVVALFGFGVDLNAPNRGVPIPPTREIPTWHGSGPQSGVIGLNSQSKSNGALRNFTPNEGVEFVFDPSTSTFLVRAPSSPVKHSVLADAIDAPRDHVVGGILTRGADGKFLTNEASGHFHQNWTPELRTQFTETMRRYGLEFDHKAGL